MASIQRRDQGARTTYVARWRDPEGAAHKKSFDRQKDARAFLDGLTADRMHGVYVDPRAGQITFRAFVNDIWFPAQLHLRPNSRRNYSTHMRNHILPALGAKRLSSLRRIDVRGFIHAQSQELAPSTVHSIFRILRTALNAAVAEDLIHRSPCRDIELPDASRGHVDPLPNDAVLALLEAMTPRYRLAIWLAAGAGLRQGEILGLRVPRVDFLRRRLHVVEQMQGRAEDGSPNLVPPKTKASSRTIPLDDEVLAQITTHMQSWEPHPSGLIITSRNGTPVFREAMNRRWIIAVERAGLPVGTRFHDLRHFYASTLIAANLHPRTIQARMGHATMAETMDTYGHLFPEAENEGRGAIGAALTRSERKAV